MCAFIFVYKRETTWLGKLLSSPSLFSESKWDANNLQVFIILISFGKNLFTI